MSRFVFAQTRTFIINDVEYRATLDCRDGHVQWATRKDGGAWQHANPEDLPESALRCAEVDTEGEGPSVAP
jgi:hypothetical protein